MAQTEANVRAETIIVTATRTPQKADQVGASITVIDATALAKSQAISVLDVLRDVPSIGYNRNGGVGSLTSVRIRGAESDQTVLLIDGIKLNDPSGPGGGYNFGNLLVGDIARIEVLRGPQSTLYGSQALGGVINIITKMGDTPFAASLLVEGGSENARRASGSIRAKAGDLSYAFSANHFQTDGVSAFASGKEADGFTHDSAQARAIYALSPYLELEARAYWAIGEVGIDGFPAPNFALADTPEISKTEELIVYSGATLTSLGGRLRTRLGASQTTTDRINLNPTLRPRETFIATGTNKSVEVQSTFDASPNVQIVAGGEVTREALKTASPSSFDPNPVPLQAQTELSAFYLQGQASPTSWLTATLGARWTHHDRFGDAINTRATLAGRFNDGNTIVRAALADGFKAPTPFQLFSAFGTSSLSPEEASSVEFGIEQAWFERRLIGTFTQFARDTTNQIDFISCFANPLALCANRPFGTYDNVAKARATGTETTLEARPMPRLTLSANYSTLDARNKVAGSANFNRILPRRAKATATLTGAYQFDFGLELSATYAHTGASFNNASNSVRLSAYDLISLRLSQKLSDHWSIYGRVENAGDEIYQTATGYGAPLREVFVGLRGTF